MKEKAMLLLILSAKEKILCFFYVFQNIVLLIGQYQLINALV